MNPKLDKTTREIERARAKIAEMQALLPGLEKQKINLENTEIVRLIRSANIDLNDLEAFLQTIPKKIMAPAAPVVLAATPKRDSKDMEDDSDV